MNGNDEGPELSPDPSQDSIERVCRAAPRARGARTPASSGALLAQALELLELLAESLREDGLLRVRTLLRLYPIHGAGIDDQGPLEEGVIVEAVLRLLV